MTTQDIRDTIVATKGKFFSISFIKSDGRVRHMTARTGVTKHLTGIFGRRDANQSRDDVITVWDSVEKGYRSIRLDRVLQFRCGNTQVDVTN